MTGRPECAFIRHLAWFLLSTEYFHFVHGIPPTSIPVSVLLSASILRLWPSSLDAMLRGPCLSAHLVLTRGEWKQLFTSPLYAHTDLHAAYAFLSLMFLGCRYERNMGAVRFAIRVVVTTAATGVVYCWLARAFAESDFPVVDGTCRYEIEHKCFTGATAVILALKVTFGVDDGVPNQWRWSIPPGYYPLLWFAIPLHPVVGALLEAELLNNWFPFLWSTGHAAGLAVGIGYAMVDFVWKKLC